MPLQLAARAVTSRLTAEARAARVEKENADDQAALELAIRRLWCALHRHDIPHSWALGQAGTDSTRSVQQDNMRSFMSRMSRMVTHFHGSSQATDELKDEADQAAAHFQLLAKLANTNPTVVQP